MARDDVGGSVALGFGLSFLLAGTALLLQEFGLLALRWSFVLPGIVVVVGLGVLSSGLVSAHRTNRRAVTGPPSDTGSQF